MSVSEKHTSLLQKGLITNEESLIKFSLGLISTIVFSESIATLILSNLAVKPRAWIIKIFDIRNIVNFVNAQEPTRVELLRLGS